MNGLKMSAAGELRMDSNKANGLEKNNLFVKMSANAVTDVIDKTANQKSSQVGNVLKKPPQIDQSLT